MKSIRNKAVKLLLWSVVTLFTLGVVFLSNGLGTIKAKAVGINESTFPDPNFRAVISGGDYDRDGNGVLDDDEIASTINIYCDGMGISSMQGIEYFYNLQGLYCTYNNISSWDLSNNKDLRGVWCSNNAFTSLDFSANPELVWVYCYDCNISSLNVSNNPHMAYIECNTNPLPYLDVTHNPELEHLTCGTCELTELNVSNNPNLSHLDAFGNHLTHLDVSHNPKMKRLDIWNNPGLGSIDVSNNPGLQYYNCAYNGASSIDVSHNPELQKLICSYNSISNLDLSNNKKLIYLDCACNSIGSLNLSKNPDLYFLQAFTNPFRSLNIGDNPSLVKVYTDGTKKAEYDVCQGHSWTIDYGGDTSTGGDNILFLCVDDAVSISTAATNSGASTGKESKGSSEANTSDTLTREMVAKTLYDMAGSPSVSGKTTRFTDAASGSWYYDAIVWGEENSICVGYPNVYSDNFGVGEAITREDMTFMLMRYAEYKGYKRAIDFGRTDEFKDYYDIDYYAWEAMTWAVTWNIMHIKGDPNAPKSEQSLDPLGKATKAEFEYMIKKMWEVNGVSKGSIPIPEKGEPAPAKTAANTKTTDKDKTTTDKSTTDKDASKSDTAKSDKDAKSDDAKTDSNDKDANATGADASDSKLADSVSTNEDAANADEAVDTEASEKVETKETIEKVNQEKAQAIIVDEEAELAELKRRQFKELLPYLPIFILFPIAVAGFFIIRKIK